MDRLIALGERLATDADFMLGLAGAVGGSFAALLGLALLAFELAVPAAVPLTIVSVGIGLAVGIPVVFWLRRPVHRHTG